jgi:glycerophosphocholine phosphodiesterase GPCPD1
MPASMPDTFGSLSLPLVAVKMQKPVGQIKIDYLLAKAMELPNVSPPTSMEVTFAKHWKKRKTLEVGHRGSGESFTKWVRVRV